jgi:hypothetical protein
MWIELLDPLLPPHMLDFSEGCFSFHPEGLDPHQVM